MAITTNVLNSNRGTQVGSLSLAAAGTYPTGGFTVNASLFGLNALFSLDVNPDSGFVFEYIPTNTTTGKLKMFWTGAGLSAALAEVTNATNVSAVTAARYEAIGA